MISLAHSSTPTSKTHKPCASNTQVEASISRKGSRSSTPATVDIAHLMAQNDGDGTTASNAPPTSIYESPNHYLHGVLHSNGFGHLVRLRVRERERDRRERECGSDIPILHSSDLHMKRQ